MTEVNGRIFNYQREVMNYYGVTDKDFENNQMVYIDNENEKKVSIYNENFDLIEER